MTHGRADGLFIISGTIASTLFLFHLGGSPVTCYLFVDKLISSLPKVAESSLRSAFALSPLCVRSVSILSERNSCPSFSLLFFGTRDDEGKEWFVATALNLAMPASFTKTVSGPLCSDPAIPPEYGCGWHDQDNRHSYWVWCLSQFYRTELLWSRQYTW